MQKRQRQIIVNFVVVILVTLISVVAMINFKDMVNRSEAMRAMESLGKEALAYRVEYGAIPPESYVDRVKGSLPGAVRVGEIHYRARWIGPGSPDDTILAYVPKNYRSSFLGRGFVVLWLDGGVDWMKPEKFNPLLREQQTAEEIRIIQEQLQ